MPGIDRLLEATRKAYIEKREILTDKFIKENLKYCPTANEQVLKFIADFLYHGVPEIDLEVSAESIRSTFCAGYCYYFAHMLLEAFSRGTVCWAAPYGHMVWVDIDGNPYDIEGVNFSDCQYYIPCSYLGGHVDDFKHVPGVTFDASKEFLESVIKKYEEDNNIDKEVMKNKD